VLGHHVHLEFKDKNGESHREEAPFPAFFHKFPVSHQFEAGNPKFQDPPAAWWGKVRLCSNMLSQLLQGVV